MYLILFIKFSIIRFHRYLLGKRSNYLVYKHWRSSNTKSTEDTLNEIELEQIRFEQRQIEQKRWILWRQMCKIGKEMGIKEYQLVADGLLDDKDKYK